MIKKLIAAAAAMLILTACGAKKPESENTPEPTESVSETTSQTEAETASETEAASQTEDNSSWEVYEGAYYTITVDPEKWTNANDMRQAAGEVAENLDDGLDLSAEQYTEMCDALFSYNDTPAGTVSANFNVVTQDVGADMDMDADALGPVMEQSFQGMEGYDCTGWESAEINGYECLITYISTTQMGVKMKMQQYIFLKGGKETIITLTAGEDMYDAALTDFEKLINTVTLK